MTRSAATTSRRSLSAPLLAVWLLLAAIVGHAVVPMGSPLQRQSGSAFSAGTVEVTTVPGRKPRPKAVAATDRPSDAGQSAGDGPTLVAMAPLAGPTLTPRAAPTHPPGPLSLAFSRIRSPHQARAPPLS